MSFVHRCATCRRLVWWFQKDNCITFLLKAGERKFVQICIRCAVKEWEKSEHAALDRIAGKVEYDA